MMICCAHAPVSIARSLSLNREGGKPVDLSTGYGWAAAAQEESEEDERAAINRFGLSEES